MATLVRMRVLTGTSGFSFKEWKGVFYPAGVTEKRMLEHYATRLAAVEINNTFYKVPAPSVFEGWAAQVPPRFVFALKAPQRVTHRERLVGSEESVRAFLQAAAPLGARLGPVLFQLPPFQKKDVPRLEAFLAALPAGVRVAFEFRHPSWFDDETFSALRTAGAALVGGDADEQRKSPPLVATAGFGYLRLRAPEYTPRALRAWADRIRAQPWTEAFVFLKHEVQGPALAGKLSGLLVART